MFTLFHGLPHTKQAAHLPGQQHCVAAQKIYGNCSVEAGLRRAKAWMVDGARRREALSDTSAFAVTHRGFVSVFPWFYLHSLVAVLYRICVLRCQAMDHASTGASLYQQRRILPVEAGSMGSLLPNTLVFSSGWALQLCQGLWPRERSPLLAFLSSGEALLRAESAQLELQRVYFDFDLRSAEPETHLSRPHTTLAQLRVRPGQ